VHAVGAPDAERVHVLARPANQRVAVVGGAADEHHPGLRELEAQGGVEHVRRGEAVVHPATRLADRAGHHVHEGCHVVVGDLLALLDLVDGE
jgi:hypothetical protein